MPHRKSAAVLRLRSLAAGLLALAGTAGAADTGWGGSFHAAIGSARISMRGEDPVLLVANLRFDFDGGPADESGSGTVTAYNEAGNLALDDFPFTWTRKGTAGFQAVLDPEGFGSFLAGRVEAAAGAETAITLTAASGKGKAGKEGGNLRFAAKSAGTASLDGGAAIRLKAKVRCR